ncbi:uncharacterized protein E6C27_scaffold55G001040 [Cucumis melo var. makuwa]|uniref:Uncharacterized protein n=1 Tax=Cucumis melo var. makuwa TaxID=1194695 RepID=A0A5A7U873_CUCMM|nr:uncharacterized protein E6C27_scaffold55G001040 [Cucumis melo var. makuwa]
MGPSFDVRYYNRCIAGGLRFHTSELDSRHSTQNNGLMVIGESDASGSGDNNFYDVLDEVLHVKYPLGRKVWLLNCQWYETDVNKSQRTHVELGYKSLNMSLFGILLSLYPRNNFLETDAMFLEFANDLDNLTRGSSSVDDNLAWMSSQPPTKETCMVLTLRVGALRCSQWTHFDDDRPWR